MTIVMVTVVAILCLAAVLTAIRFFRGPAVLDRVVALDMLLVIVVCGLGAAAAFSQKSSIVPILVVVALLGFVGSVSIARFIAEEEEQ